jgi:hypothetical protein
MNIPHLQKLALSVLALSIAGCAGNAGTSSSSATDTTFADKLSAREKAVDAREDAVRRRESAASSASQDSSSNQSFGANDSSLLPPNAKVGECYARVWVDATYRTEDESIQVKDAQEIVKQIDATYRWVEQEVLVKEASSRINTIPAVYGTESERIQTRAESTRWLTDLNKSSAPANDKLLASAKAGGINLDSATPGMCFHEHFIAAKFQNVTERVLVSEASSRIETQDAQYEWVEESVLVAGASTRYESVPSVYKTETERVLDKPAHTIWKKGTGPIQRIDEATGEIMCLVEVPATYKTITKQVLVSGPSKREIEIPAKYETVKVRKLATAASERNIDIPAEYKDVNKSEKVADAEFVWHEVSDNTLSAESRTGAQICLVREPAQYKTIARKVVITPASTQEIAVDAQYETVRVKELVSAASEERTVIPAVYKTVQKRELVTDGHMQWRSILCETNMTRDRIAQIQSELDKRGFDPGPIDGIIGAQTIIAVNEFQRKNKLPFDRYLNLSTVEALGVSPM